MLLIELTVLNPGHSFKGLSPKNCSCFSLQWTLMNGYSMDRVYNISTMSQTLGLRVNNMALFTVTGMRWYSSEFYEAPVKRTRPSTREVDDGSYVIPPGRSQTEDWSQTYTTTRIKRSLQHFNRLPAMSDADQLRNIITAAKDADFNVFSQRLLFFLKAGH